MDQINNNKLLSLLDNIYHFDKMERKLKSLGLLTILAFLSNTSSGNCVRAELLAGQESVIRIDLERKYINHIDNL